MQSHHPLRHPDVFVQDLGRDRLLSRFDTDQLHILNWVAFQIWLYCDGQHAPEAIVQRLAECFPAAPVDRVSADVHNTLADLATKGLLHNDVPQHFDPYL
ncbi:PqqD family peptide modification chaperone [bacterium]|nr:PqqD family peptide modification chaperone [bacterium]